MKKRPALQAFLLVLALLPASLAALPAPLAGSRADDGGLWSLEANPALMGADQGLRFGVAYDGMSSSGATHVAFLTPFTGYLRLSGSGTDLEVVLGQALSFSKAFAFGYDFTYSSSTNLLSSYTLGLLLRPTSWLSAGLTGLYDANAGFVGGLGLGFRPGALLGLAGPLGRALTLTADGFWTSTAFHPESLGLHVLLGETFDLQGSYVFPASGGAGGLCLGIRVALGPLGLSLASPDVGAVNPGYRVAEDFGASLASLSPRAGSASLGAPPSRILLIKDLDEILPVPAEDNPLAGLFSSKRVLSFPALLDLVEGAAKDGRIKALAIENLPSLGGLANYQEFAGALARFRASGKKVFIYGESFGNEYPVLAREADHLALYGQGSVLLQGLGFHRAYLKGLLDRLGIRFVNLAAWDTKSAYNDLTAEAMPAAEAAMMRNLYADYEDQLAADLEAARPGRLLAEAVAILDRGPYLQARQALEAGLVDSLGYAQDFEARVKAAYPGAGFVSGLGEGQGQDWGRPAFSKTVAVVWLEGSIGVGKGSRGTDIGRTAATALEELRRNPMVSGIVLRVDSPGGAVLTSDLIAREVRLAVASGKPVVVSMGHVAGSGGYYLSAPASWIVAEPGTVTGSIGVTGLLPDLSEALAKLGIVYDGFDFSPHASFLDPLRPADPKELEVTRAWIAGTYDTFIQVVAEGRRLPAERVRSLAEGRVYTGRQALGLGLVDELGGLKEAKAWMEGRVGGRVAYVDVVPGEAPGLLASLGGLGSLLRVGLGEAGAEAAKDLAAGFAAEAARLRDLGAGPVYYLDLGALPF